MAKKRAENCYRSGGQSGGRRRHRHQAASAAWRGDVAIKRWHGRRRRQKSIVTAYRHSVLPYLHPACADNLLLIIKRSSGDINVVKSGGISENVAWRHLVIEKAKKKKKNIGGDSNQRRARA